jgi:predicted nucleic acid-binding protein
VILVDSSVWIDHLRNSNKDLVTALETARILTHDYVIGELALGSLRDRDLVLHHLRRLPHATQVNHAEVMHLIEAERLFGTGIGYIDAHLLGSARLASAFLWTLDKRLRAVAERLGIAANVTESR